MPSVLEKVRGFLDKKQTSATASYRTLVRQLANGGKEPGAGEIAEAIENAGKTLEDLEADIAIHQRRVELAATMKRKPDAQRETEAVNARLKAARQKLEAAEEEFNQSAEPLYQRYRELEAEIQAADKAEAELMSSTPNQDLAAELNATRHEATSHNNELARLRLLIHKLQPEILSDMAQVGLAGADPDKADIAKLEGVMIGIGQTTTPAEWVTGARKKKASIASCEASIIDLEAAKAKALARVAELEAEALKP